MGYTLKQYNALVEAIASGAKFVKYSDKEVEYMPIAEMKRLKREMEVDLGLASKVSRRRVGVYDKGLAGNRLRLGSGGSVPAAGAATQTKSESVKIWVKTSPDPDATKELRSGVVINTEYAPGAKITIAYFKSAGVWVELPLFVNNEVRQDMEYTQGSGEFVKPNGEWENDEYMTIKFEFNG